MAIAAGAFDFNPDLNAAAELELASGDAATAVSSDARSQISSRSSAQIIAQTQAEEKLDPDNDMYGQILQVGQPIDFYLNGYWISGKIEIATEEMIKCAVNLELEPGRNQTSHWFELESNNLAPAGSQTRNDKEILHKFYVDLAQYIV